MFFDNSQALSFMNNLKTKSAQQLKLRTKNTHFNCCYTKFNIQENKKRRRMRFYQNKNTDLLKKLLTLCSNIILSHYSFDCNQKTDISRSLYPRRLFHFFLKEFYCQTDISCRIIAYFSFDSKEALIADIVKCCKVFVPGHTSLSEGYLLK